jgi:hypothetical protein
MSLFFNTVLLIRLTIQSNSRSIFVKFFEPNDAQCLLLTGHPQSVLIPAMLRSDGDSTSSVVDFEDILDRHIDSVVSVIGKVVTEKFNTSADGSEPTSLTFKAAVGHPLIILPASTSAIATASFASPSNAPSSD